MRAGRRSARPVDPRLHRSPQTADLSCRRPRATCVAAGMPISVTSTASAIAAAVRSGTGQARAPTPPTTTRSQPIPRCLAPGCRRPMPKNVATSVAHSGAGRDATAVLPAAALSSDFRHGSSVLVLIFRRTLVGSALLASRNRRWNHVSPAGPFAQIDRCGSGRCRKGSRRRCSSRLSCRSGSEV